MKFECKECAKHPKEEFEIFELVDDWMICYPEKKTIHIHYGKATHNEKDNLAETKFITENLYKWAKQYPDIKFYLFVDFTRGDDSEFIPPEALQMYKKILSHPQLNQGIIYGGTASMRHILNLLFKAANKHVKVVFEYKEAIEEYEKWLAN